MDDILLCNAETGMMTKHGAGTSAYFGGLRPRGSAISMGGTSFGAVHFMQMFDKTTKIVSQSNIRRGSFAAYMPVESPDIADFLEIREEGNPIHVNRLLVDADVVLVAEIGPAVLLGPTRVLVLLPVPHGADDSDERVH